MNLSTGGNQVCNFDRTVFYNNNTGSGSQGGLVNTQAACNMQITNCALVSNTGAGMYLQGQFTSQLVNCILYGNSTYGIDQPSALSVKSLVNLTNDLTFVDYD